ncbi:hypothetical protein XMM354_003299 [Aliiroseovarius sp. xm-m-354]|nr:hypothetical protein [Aliiroseovarius sp. xm-m-354]
MITLRDINEPSVVFRRLMAGLQQFFEHHRDFDPIRRGQRIQLKRMLAHGQVFVMGRTGDGPVGAGKFAAALRFPFPNFRGRIFGRIRHVDIPCNSGLLCRWGFAQRLQALCRNEKGRPKKERP